jgi:membrane-bound serine protease (ClpP class)
MYLSFTQLKVGSVARTLGLIGSALALISGAAAMTSYAQDADREVVRLTIDGPIGPATAEYVTSGLADAADSGAPLVVLQMDTPGGLDTAMRDIIQAILASPVPVASYVGPSGARAASAGTYILYASHIAAMAPGTNLGAATPVNLDGPPTQLPNDEPADEASPDSSSGGSGADTDPAQDGEAAADDGVDDASAEADSSEAESEDSSPARAPARDAMTAKAINDSTAYIRSLAKMRGRNAEWAAKAVREAASLDAESAVEENVVDLIAKSVRDLLTQIDGREVEADGKTVTLEVADAPITDAPMDWRLMLLSLITQPNVALILMMIGTYGILFELYSPGAMVPGVLGSISLLLGLYALNVLPVNYAGLGLMALGLALMTAEAFAPSFGILGLGGLASFLFGATMLFDTDVPGFQLSLGVLGGVGAVSAGLLALAAYLGIGAHRRAVVSGVEEMIGQPATVLDWSGESGHVRVHGESWHATGPAGLASGQTVIVQSVYGLNLTVTANT